MEAWIRNLDRAPGLLMIALAAAIVVLGLLIATLLYRQRRLAAKWASLLEGTSGESVESLLHEHLAERTEMAGRLKDAEERVEVLERKMRSAKRYLGIVNFDAFEDIGGSQSFSLAVYDEEGNGAVLTSQVGREGCRVYGKSLVHGKPDRHLSSEEERAIEQATEARARPRISP